MSSFFEDLKLLHPNLKLPSGSELSTWKEKLVDSTISPDEWAVHARDFLREIGEADYHSLFADTDLATPDHDGICGSAIIGYMLKVVTESLVEARGYGELSYIPYFDSRWHVNCEWPTETRCSQYDRFLDFVANLCFRKVPTGIKKGRDILACATLIEVHYLIRLLDYSSKTYKRHEHNEHGGGNHELKRLLDSAFNIYLRCDPALYKGKGDRLSSYCSSLKSHLNVAIYDAAKRYNIMPTHMYVKGVIKIGRDPVGSGGFADVWKGMVNGSVVALKVPRLHCEGVELKIVEAQACKEGLIWNRLSHENILPLLGFYSTANEPIAIMVSPWMDNGNLTTYLRHNESANRQELMYGVYRGLCYLHGRNPPIVHGDLRCANILVDNLGKPLISDFGLSRVQDIQLSLPTGYASGVSGGSYRWQAPELWRGTGKHTTSSDVYAYAMTCLEVYSGKKPLDNYNEAQFIMKFAKGVALEIPESIKTSNSRVAREREQWWQDLTRCCSADAAHRLSTLEAIRMVCAFSPGLWQTPVCKADYNDLQAVCAHKSCIPSECIWTLKGLLSSAEDIATDSEQIADFSEDVIHLRNVDTLEIHCVDRYTRLLKVRKGVMDGIVVALREPMMSAVVRYGGTTAGKETSKKIKDECSVWIQLRHRNILPLLGIISQNDAAPALVTPWLEYSTLGSCIQEHSVSDPYKILYGVYDGLCYLHSCMPPIVHGEICSNTILLDNLGNPLLADLGLSKIQGFAEYPILGHYLDDDSEGLRWKAPELILCHASGWISIGENYTTMSDVYAFALVCLEIHSGNPPFYYYETDAEVHSIFSHGHRKPLVPHNLKTSDIQLASMREKWWARLQTCWAINPMDRPVVEDMKRMLYFPASVDDPRNETHGYTLSVNDDFSHKSCNNDTCFWTFKPEFEIDCLSSEDEDDSDSSEDEDDCLSKDEDDFAVQTV